MAIVISGEDRLYDMHAAICKTFASPWRLRIVEALGEEEQTVSYLVAHLGIPKSNVSQHLAVMREKGMVEYRRASGRVFYRLSNPKILQACRLMREVLLEQLDRAGQLSQMQRQLTNQGQEGVEP